MAGQTVMSTFTHTTPTLLQPELGRPRAAAAHLVHSHVNLTKVVPVAPVRQPHAERLCEHRVATRLEDQLELREHALRGCTWWLYQHDQTQRDVPIRQLPAPSISHCRQNAHTRIDTSAESSTHVIIQ